MLRSIYVRWECEPIGEGGAELPLVFGGGGDEAQEWREGEEVLTTLLLQMLLSEVTISQVFSIPIIPPYIRPLHNAGRVD